MKILYYIPYPEAIGAALWIYKGWKHAFEDSGHHFLEVTASEDMERKVRRESPDILFIANLIDLVVRKDTLLRIRKTGSKVFLVLSWPLSLTEIEVIREYDIADIYFGEREELESPNKFREATGRDYHVIPYAADRRLNFPTEPVPKYQYDIVYLGARLPKKKQAFEEVLRPLMRKHKVGVFGPYWTTKDNILRVCQRLSQELNSRAASEFFLRKRIAIPEDEENRFYSSAKISLNFHERESDGSQPHYVLNQRTFKIPACGGFQICDYVPALGKYFAADEVVMAGSSRDCLAKVEYYLKHDEERRAIQAKGTAKALRCHTYHERVRHVLSLAQLSG